LERIFGVFYSLLHHIAASLPLPPIGRKELEIKNSEMQIYPVANFNEPPAYNDQNVTIWAETLSTILLHVKADNTFIGMDCEGWEELLRVVNGFEIPQDTNGVGYYNQAHFDQKISIWIGEHLTPEKKGEMAVQIYYGHTALFTKREWQLFKASINEADQVVSKLVAEDDEFYKKCELGLIEHNPRSRFVVGEGETDDDEEDDE
jgi:hypothetical protein